MSREIAFVFDYVSPYAYLASTQIETLAARHGCTVRPVPVLFAGLLGASGARGPAEIPAKREYLAHDVERLARMLGVPLEPPATHPFNPLVALRATACVDSERRWPFVHALFGGAWARGLRIDQPEVVAAVAAEVGLDGRALLEEAAGPRAKELLRAATDDVIAAGVFGVPTMRVAGEIFWGVDSLPLLSRFLEGQGGVAGDRLARWRKVEPSATRRTARPNLLAAHLRAENDHDLEGIMATYAPSPAVVLNGRAVEGAEAVREFHRLFGFGGDAEASFSNVHVAERHRHTAEGAVVLEQTLSGLHTGTWQGIASTGRAFEVAVCTVYVFDAEGRLAMERVYLDEAWLRRQLTR